MCVCVCLSVNFFFVRNFSGTTTPKILKFGTNIGYDSLYCGKENWPTPVFSSIYLSIFLFLQCVSTWDIHNPLVTLSSVVISHVLFFIALGPVVQSALA